MIEIIPDYRLDFGKFNLWDFEEVKTGRVLQLVHHVGKEVGKEITVTVEFQKFTVVLRRYGLEFPVFIYAFYCADCLFLLIQYKNVNSTLAVSNIRNRTYTDYEVYLIDYGYGNFKEKIHFME